MKVCLPVAGETQPLVAVGTCQSFGEDYPGTGRVLFFEIIRKAATAEETEEQWDANMIYSRYAVPLFFCMGCCCVCPCARVKTQTHLC